MGQGGAAVFVIIALLFLLLWFAVVVYGFVRVLGGRISTMVPLSDVATLTLQRNFVYYARADAWQRWRIRRRVKHLIADKEWIGRGLEVSRDMKAMVAACAIQLMWGWKDAEMLFFRRVII